jgi:hypothetical protein
MRKCAVQVHALASSYVLQRGVQVKVTGENPIAAALRFVAADGNGRLSKCALPNSHLHQGRCSLHACPAARSHFAHPPHTHTLLLLCWVPTALLLCVATTQLFLSKCVSVFLVRFDSQMPSRHPDASCLIPEKRWHLCGCQDIGDMKLSGVMQLSAGTSSQWALRTWLGVACNTRSDGRHMLHSRVQQGQLLPACAAGLRPICMCSSAVCAGTRCWMP